MKAFDAIPMMRIIFKDKIHYFFLAMGIIFMAGCATVEPKMPVSPVFQEMILKDLCDINHVYCSWDSLSSLVTLKKDGFVAKVMVDTDVVLVGKEKVFLTSPVRMTKSRVIVPPDFKYKVMDRFRRAVPSKKGSPARFPVSASYPKVGMVIIDAGHGGKDPGAIGRTGLYEKDVVLDIARRVKKLLAGQKIKVKMTRDNDKFVSLLDRTRIASGTKADIFVSIHANSNRVRSVYGVEVFSLKDLDYFDKNEAQRAANHRLMFKHLSMKQDDAKLQKILENMLYAHKQAESERLASFMAQKISSFGRTKNRGLKKSHFYVLRNTLSPAVLIEVGFLSNPKEERLLRTSAYRQKIAIGIVKGILDYAKAR